MKARKKGRTSSNCVLCNPAKLPGGSPVFPFERPTPMPADQAQTISLGWPTPISVSWAPSEPKRKVRRQAKQAAPAAAAAVPERPKERLRVKAVPAEEVETLEQAAVKAHAEDETSELPAVQDGPDYQQTQEADPAPETAQAAPPEDAAPKSSRAPASSQPQRSGGRMRRASTSTAQVIQQMGSVIRHR